jgi:hypothetical protein
MFNPVAKGIKPKIVVIAVNKTGRKRALPPLTMASIKSFSIIISPILKGFFC